MNVLGIETSCDETAAAVYNEQGLRSNVVASQSIHVQYGGVVPELASREHIRLISPIVKKSLDDANLALEQLDGIAVTYGPGLVGSLLVGLNFAKALAFANAIPFVGINHIEGHIFANLIDNNNLDPPFICLIISGGHTQLVLIEEFGKYQTLGKTRDDAAGEAFDKVAKMLDIGYPGGPLIDRLARGANNKFISFPRPMLNENNYDFSFSGIKTAVLYYIRKLEASEIQIQKNDIAASFQAALVEVLISKTIAAAVAHGVNTIALAGGVASNMYLREHIEKQAAQMNLKLYIPLLAYCTDNAAMIARTGFYYLNHHITSPLSLSPKPSLKLNTV